MSPRLGTQYALDYDTACGVVLSRSLQSSEVGIRSPGFKSQLGEVTGYTACILGPARHPVFPQLDDLCLCISLDGKWAMADAAARGHGHPDGGPSSLLNHDHGQLEAPCSVLKPRFPHPILGQMDSGPKYRTLPFVRVQSRMSILSSSRSLWILTSRYREFITLWHYVRAKPGKSEEKKRSRPGGTCLETSLSKGGHESMIHGLWIHSFHWLHNHVTGL